MATTVTLIDKEAVLKAIAAVREDSSDIDWVLLHHPTEPGSIGLQQTGTKGLSELKTFLKADSVQYALLRVTNQIDMSKTVKFVYIYHLGQDLALVKRGRYGVVKGDVTKYFYPFHVDIEIENPSEITAEKITAKVEAAAGNANHVRDADFVKGKQERGYTPALSLVKNHSKEQLTEKVSKVSEGLPKAGVIATQSQGVSIAQELTAAIKLVRSGDQQWVLGTYSDQKTIQFLESGNNVNDLKKHLKKDNICYGLVRVLDKIDGHDTIKFAHVIWLGEGINLMTRAKISTHKGAVQEVFAPYHVDLTASDEKEISYEIIHDKVAAYSGSKSHVV